MCTEAQGAQIVSTGEQAVHHHKHTNDLLEDVLAELRILRHKLTDEPETWNVTVSQNFPLAIDRRGRRYLYILSPTTFTLQAPTQGGDAPLTITQGVFTILPFHTGEYLTAPAAATPITVLLIAQNEVIR